MASDVGLLHFGRAHADILSRLQHAQQPDLGGVRQLGHLVQKDRAAVGLLEIALAGLYGTGEGPLLVAEELRVDRSLGNGAAVDGDVFVVLAGRKGVDDLGKELFTHAALARYQHREIGGSYAQGYLQSTVQELGVADDAEALFDGCQVCHVRLKMNSVTLLRAPLPAKRSARCTAAPAVRRCGSGR